MRCTKWPPASPRSLRPSPRPATMCTPLPRVLSVRLLLLGQCISSLAVKEQRTEKLRSGTRKSGEISKRKTATGSFRASPPARALYRGQPVGPKPRHSSRWHATGQPIVCVLITPPRAKAPAARQQTNTTKMRHRTGCLDYIHTGTPVTTDGRIWHTERAAWTTYTQERL